MKNIQAAEFARIWPNLNSDEVVIDVRETDEYEEGHVPGSINVSLSSIGRGLAELKKYNKIFLICETGGRSSYATEVLKTAEVEAIDIVGGLSGLKAFGMSLESGPSN